MPLSAELLSGLDVALNEADLQHVEVRVDRAAARVGLAVLTLPEVGPKPTQEDRIVWLYLRRVGRVVASLREGRWDDENAAVTPFNLDDLDDVVDSFGVQPIYGWEFFDAPDSTWQRLGHRTSLDLTLPGGSSDHTLDLFQESLTGPPRHLDVRLWFGYLVARSQTGAALELEDLVLGGRRWWDGLAQGDARTDGHGIVPGGKI